MFRSLTSLLGGCALLWVLLAIPARHLWGDWILAYSATAAITCLVPASISLAWVFCTGRRDPESFMIVALGGTGIRLFAVGGAALAIQSWLPFYREHAGFWAWLLVFYLATLALEMGLILSGRGSGHKPEAASVVAAAPATPQPACEPAAGVQTHTSH